MGARMTAFAGWEMPESYQGILAESRAVRTGAGLFDVSHLGRYQIQGELALPFMEYLLVSRILPVAVGRARYTLLCHEEGGILDDSLVYHLEQQRYWLVSNALNRVKVGQWLHRWAGPYSVEIADVSPDTAALALQGPSSPMILAQLGDPSAIQGLGPFNCLQTMVGGCQALVSRTGYTGEDGFEIVTGAAEAPGLWQRLLDLGAVPCGLGARDVLRLEAGFVLYGNDIDEMTNPYEAGLGWLVHLDKGEFLGREALQRIKERGVRRRLIGLQMQGREIPRAGYAILVGGDKVGQVTSGTHSPILGTSIGLGYVTPEMATAGTQVEVDIRGKLVPAIIVKGPFYRSRPQS
ncbi:MAG: glycine cleavage system aminomethyltransferase GcvT [Chloroflexi bacterium]|nr:glycine cleavage system aminomethyltransferase GcvT [Chloroflexota bacterium]